MADTDAADVERIMRRIAVRRVLLGLAKHEAAALLGMNPWQVGIWETGRQVPSATNLARYARLVGLRLVTVEETVVQTATAALLPDDPALPDDADPFQCDVEGHPTPFDRIAPGWLACRRCGERFITTEPALTDAEVAP